MANICSTAIQFTGEEEALKDLFEKIDCGWLGEIAETFDIAAEVGGDIDGIDTGVYRIWQSDRWSPKVEIWRLIIDKYYKDKISFVYIAEEIGCGIYINTDETGEHFPEEYRVEYEIGREADTLYLSSEEELVETVNKLLSARVDTKLPTYSQIINKQLPKPKAQTTKYKVKTEAEALDAADDFNKEHGSTGEYITIGVFQSDEY